MTSNQIPNFYPGGKMQNKPLKPGVHARREIIRKIIQAEWEPGLNLPSERNLSEQLGVTRATLREVLKLIEKEGWIKIRHGKPSCVKNFWEEGGLGILSGLNENKDLFPLSLVEELLGVRADILPICSIKAFEKNYHSFKKLLENNIPGNDSGSEDFTFFDWMLQTKIIGMSENRVYKLVFNEFEPLFLFFGKEYFKIDSARESSIKYYQDLKTSLDKNQSPHEIISQAMEESIRIWNKLSGQ